jgi:hypothetical protein
MISVRISFGTNLPQSALTQTLTQKMPLICSVMLLNGQHGKFIPISKKADGQRQRLN